MSHAVSGSKHNNVSSSDSASIPIQSAAVDAIAPLFPVPYQAIGGVPSVQPQDSNIDIELQEFWKQQYNHIAALTGDELKANSLPLARIKKIMKSDEDVRMISAEAPILFSKACEIFILELTQRAWNHAEANRRRTVQRIDISQAISTTDIFDFLVDIVPRDGFEHFMDVQMMDTNHQDHPPPPPPNGVFPITQGNLLNNPGNEGAFESVVNPEQNRFLSHYLRFNHQ
eukprot:g2030.t1